MTEMFKIKENLSPPFMEEIFREHNITYDLRHNNEFMLPRAKTVSYGTETIKYRGQRLWLSLQRHIKNAQSVIEFKSKIKVGMLLNAHADYVGRLYHSLNLYDTIF